MGQMEEFTEEILAWCERKGWRGKGSPPRTFGDEIALITSELSEAIEAFRDSGSVDTKWYSYSIEVAGVKFKNLDREQVRVITGQAPETLGLVGKPEGVASELADTFIRLFDTCGTHGIDIVTEIREKMAYNEGREFRHGGRAL